RVRLADRSSESALRFRLLRICRAALGTRVLSGRGRRSRCNPGRAELPFHERPQSVHRDYSEPLAAHLAVGTPRTRNTEMIRHTSGDHRFARCAAMLVAVVATATLVPTLSAQDVPTYSRDIAPIMQGVCQKCHVEGGLGPMPLTSYQQVRRWASR